MTFPTITDLPSAPQRTQTPDAFATTADTFVAALPDLVTEVNTAGAYIDTKTISVGNAFQVTYSAGTTYTTGQSVLYGSKFYLSLVDSNTGNTPDSSPSQWVEIVGAVTPAVGGTNTFTSSGAITAGDPVGLNSDGTVSTCTSLGLTETYFETDSSYYMSVAYDTGNNKVVIAYRDDGNSSYGTAIVGTISGTSITFGTPVVFESAQTNEIQAIFDPDSGNVVIVYADGGNSNYATAIVGVVSGTSISFGAPVVFGGTSIFEENGGITYDTTNNKVVIAYRDTSNSSYGTAIVGSVSGNVISFGSKVVYESALTYSSVITFDSNAGKVVICYRDGGNSNQGTYVVGTVSGSSISFGTAAVFTTNNNSFYSAGITFDSNSNKVVVAYRNSALTPAGSIRVGTVSGTTITWGDRVTYDIGSTISYARPQALTFNTTSNKVAISFGSGSASGSRYLVEGTVSGSTITLGSNISLNTLGSYGTIAYDPDNNVYIIAYRDGSSVDSGAVQIYNAASTLGAWIGFATETVADATETTVTTIGGINESQTGLTTASTYYLQNDATVSATEATGREVGRATAATKLYVTQGSITL